MEKSASCARFSYPCSVACDCQQMSFRFSCDMGGDGGVEFHVHAESPTPVDVMGDDYSPGGCGKHHGDMSSGRMPTIRLCRARPQGMACNRINDCRLS